MSHARVRHVVALTTLVLAGTDGCTGAVDSAGPIAKESPSGGSGSAVAGSGGTGIFSAGAGGVGGSAGGVDLPPPGGAGETPDAGAPPADAGVGVGPDAPSAEDYGGVGDTPYVPLHYTAAPVLPIIAPECPDDPTVGFTEYQGSFKVQRPRDLAARDRFKYEDGIYTFWVQSNDEAHTASSNTAPRTEARYENFSAGEHIWSADMMYEHVDNTCIMQIHNVVGSYAVYLRIVDDRMFDLATRDTVLTDYQGKWFNLKIAFNTETLDVRVFVNDCLKMTAKSPRGPTPDWYFKHGVYTCRSGTCLSHYKNIHVYHRGSSEPPITP